MSQSEQLDPISQKWKDDVDKLRAFVKTTGWNVNRLIQIAEGLKSRILKSPKSV